MKKKIGAGPAMKSGAGISGKSSSPKPATLTSSAKNKLGSSVPIPKSPLPSTSTSRSYNVTSYSTPKTSKPSTFGIIWLPTRKNKKKEQVWNSHNNERYKDKDRSPTMYNFMSGDSEPYKKRDEVSILIPESKNTAPINVSATVAVADAALEAKGLEKLDEKQGHTRQSNEDSKEAAGDTNENNSAISKENIGPDEIKNACKAKQENDNDVGDKVDGVLIQAPLHKTRSMATVEEEEDCAIKCLYYTLQCCDCVLM